MKVAIIHDYIKEYGGAERVLEELHRIYPDAPIYTAFYKRDSKAYERIKGAKIVASWAQYIPFFAEKLHSPLRFLTPLIWGSFDFSNYDVVISSASWYVTKGFGTRGSDKKRPVEICYCHTPPRWLYGYKTSVEWQKYWPVKLYATLVGHFMRLYDFKQAQKVNYFVANSQEVKRRIEKFYRREATVVYPPVSLPAAPKVKKEDFYLVVGRIVGSKGLELAIGAAKKLKIKLKIVGVSGGYYGGEEELSRNSTKNVEFLGFVSDEELAKLYAQAKGFLALAEDEDFGITPVEAMLSGTPVIAYFGGGYKESVVDRKTGVFFKEYTVDSLVNAIKKFEKMRISPEACRRQAKKFSKEGFDRKIKEIVNKLAA